MSWFLKYRPKQIKDLDLTSVRQTFKQMMELGKLPQTLLFAGPKGTGKTSTSRIIGTMLNDPENERVVDHLFFNKKKPKKTELQEPDLEREFAQKVYRGHSYVVQEMDAASNRGIDDIRTLKERISLPPQEGKIAVYILDEVHMLTNEAFNALLKILEEPPAHVVFILATTELHKVPATIVSRCTLIRFRKGTQKEIINRLKKILKDEAIDFEQEALVEIARRADGSFRDAVKLAEMASKEGNLSLAHLEAVAGGSALAKVKKLVRAVLDKDEVAMTTVFEDLRAQNFDQDYFYQTLFDLLHQSLMKAIGAQEGQPIFNKKVAQFLLKELIGVDFKTDLPISYLALEIKLLEIIQRAKKAEPNSGGSQGVKKEISSKSQDRVKSNETKQKIEAVQYSGDESLSQVVCDRWEELLDSVARKNSTLAALLRSGQPHSGPNGTAKISVYYSFHQEQLQQPKFKSLIEKCGQELVGDKIQFKFVLDNPPSNAELVEVPAESNKLEVLAQETLMGE